MAQPRIADSWACSCSCSSSFQAQMDSDHDVGLSRNGGNLNRQHCSAVTGVFPSGMLINMR